MIYNVFTACVTVTRRRRHNDYILLLLPTGRNMTNSHSAVASAVSRFICVVGPDRNRKILSIRFHINHWHSTITLITIITVHVTCALTVSDNAYKTERLAVWRYILYSQRIAIVTMSLLLNSKGRCSHSTTVVVLSVAVLLTVGQVQVSTQYIWSSLLILHIPNIMHDAPHV